MKIPIPVGVAIAATFWLFLYIIVRWDEISVIDSLCGGFVALAICIPMMLIFGSRHQDYCADVAAETAKHAAIAVRTAKELGVPVTELFARVRENNRAQRRVSKVTAKAGAPNPAVTPKASSSEAEQELARRLRAERQRTGELSIRIRTLQQDLTAQVLFAESLQAIVQQRRTEETQLNFFRSQAETAQLNVSALEQRLDQTAAALAEAVEALGESEAARGAAEKESSERRAALESTSSRNVELEARLSESESSVRDMQTTLGEMTLKLAQELESAGNLSLQLRDARTEVGVLKAELERCEAKEQAQGSEIVRLRSEENRLGAELRTLAATHQRLGHEHSTLSATAKSLSDEKARLEAVARAAELKASTDANNIQRLKELVETLQLQVGTRDRTKRVPMLSSKPRTTAASTEECSRCASLNAEFLEMKGRFSGLEEELSLLHSVVNALTAEVGEDRANEVMDTVAAQFNPGQTPPLASS